MDVLRTLSLVREGRIFELARPRFRGMPNFAGHPRFDVVSYRTPRGLRLEGEGMWAAPAGGCSGYLSELIIGSAHSGAHVDALAHVTAGSDDHWHGGGRADDHLGDFGPTRGDAAALRPIWARGVLLDVPRARGVEALRAGEPVTAEDLRATADAQGVRIAAGDVVLVRTGFMAGWPDEQRLARVRGAGPDLGAARWLSALGIAATGADNDNYEVVPPGSDGAALPVHAHLLVEHGILIMENLDLEPLAAAGITEFLFVALPLKIHGATGSMIDPVAVV